MRELNALNVHCELENIFVGYHMKVLVQGRAVE